MQSEKKRKADGELPAKEKPETASSSKTTSTPKYVYIVQNLQGDPYVPFEQDIIGIYTNLEVANSVAHDHYNRESPTGPVSLPSYIKPEDESLQNGRYHGMADDARVDDDLSDGIANIRLRHDGGLRFGACDQEVQVCVFWVERMELDPPIEPKFEAAFQPIAPVLSGHEVGQSYGGSYQGGAAGAYGGHEGVHVGGLDDEEGSGPEPEYDPSYDLTNLHSASGLNNGPFC